MRRPVPAPPWKLALALVPPLALGAVLVASAFTARADPDAERGGVTVTGVALRPGARAPSPPPSAPAAVVATCRADDPVIVPGQPLGPPQPAGGGTVMSPQLGGGSGFYAVDGPVPPARSDRQHTSPLELSLALTAPATRAPDAALGLTLSFEVRGRASLVVLRALDGSLEHWRQPTYDLYLQREGDPRTYRWAYVGGRCGNVNPLTPADYVTLRRGARRTDVAGEWADYLRSATVGQPGRYSAWVVYRFCGEFGSRGVPLGDDHVRPETHVGRYASNAVRFEVR